MVEQKSKYPNLWVDEKSNAIASLLTAAILTKQEEDYKWIWIIQTLHHSLYSLCISVIVHGNPENVLKPKHIKKKAYIIFTRDEYHFYKLTFEIITKLGFGRYKLIELTDQNEIDDFKKKISDFSLDDLSFNFESFEKCDLITFQDALGRVMEGELLLGSFVGNNPLELSDGELKDIYRIHDLRNKFTHFKPMLYVDNIPSIKKSLLTYIKSIEFLLFEISPTILFLDENKREELKPVIDSIKKNLIAE